MLWGHFNKKKGNFSHNPKGQHVIKASDATKENFEQLKVITILRSEKEIDKIILPKVSPKVTLWNEKETKGNSREGE